jgi:hypothetical protein
MYKETKMRIDLSDLKIYDYVFSSRSGKQRIASLDPYLEDEYPVKTESKEWYTINGLNRFGDKHPTLFHSIEECTEYFQSVQKEMEEAAKPKKKYWLWSLIGRKHYHPQKYHMYLDEDGRHPNGDINDFFANSPTRIKHENEFIDV